MLSTDQILLFSATAVLLAFTPGPDILYVLTRGAAQGRRAGFAAAAGFSLGNLVHTFFAVVGLSALLASSATAFAVVKIAGAAYLVWIGIRLFRSPGGHASGGGLPDKALWTIFRQSVVANILNPKVAVFFLALFPPVPGAGARGRRPADRVPGAAFHLLDLCVLRAGGVGLGVRQRLAGGPSGLRVADQRRGRNRSGGPGD